MIDFLNILKQNNEEINKKNSQKEESNQKSILKYRN